MNSINSIDWNLIISIISLIVGIFAILFFSLYPEIKKIMINKTFTRINDFFEIYSYLNPCYLNQLNKTEEITKRLIKQNFLQKCFPKFRYSKKDEIYNFDPFLFQNSYCNNTLTMSEICYFYKVWKLSFKKISNIVRTINKFEYITISNFSEHDSYYDYNKFNTKIVESSISLCPSFDEMKLFGSISNSGTEIKANLEKILQSIKNKKFDKFIKELKSNTFSLNIRFNCWIQNHCCAYSIKFENGKIENIEPFWEKEPTIEISKLDDDEKQKIKNQINELKKIFNYSLVI